MWNDDRYIPITTKFAAFFEFDFPNSAKTSKFLLVTLGVLSILIASTPAAAWSTFLSPFAFADGLLDLDFADEAIGLVYFHFLDDKAEPFDWAAMTTSSGLGPAKASVEFCIADCKYGNASGMLVGLEL